MGYRKLLEEGAEDVSKNPLTSDKAPTMTKNDCTQVQFGVLMSLLGSLKRARERGFSGAWGDPQTVTSLKSPTPAWM